ncbi:hypothetical protein DPMN_146848 [Dreissena polymorpha]|uniref:Macro domain-containing protein n=1 Tax=Dreissena polymorpha TaxID=45954 RepID=A0A9D4J034_DREPO|nr:hypothetical protein DPMN_146848 [Dreissena polymorpha]
MLIADKFDRDMEVKYTGAKVTINQENHEIEIEGVDSVVKNIQAEMNQRKYTYKKIQTTSPVKLEQIYRSKIVDEYIEHKLEQADVIAVWEAEHGKLHVISKSGEMVDKAVTIVQTSVKIGPPVKLTTEHKSLIETIQWKQFLSKLSTEHKGKLQIDISEDSEITLLSTDDIHDELLEDIHDFLDTNTIYAEMWRVEENVLQLLMQYHRHDIRQITKGTNVKCKEQSFGFELTGTKNDLESAKRKLDTFVAQIKEEPYSVSKPGISEFWKSDKGRGIQNSVETAHHVILKSSYDRSNEEPDVFDIGARSGDHHSGSNVMASCTVYGTRMISVTRGDITDLDVDVIVYSANSMLQLNSGLGKAILTKGNFKSYLHFSICMFFFDLPRLL